MSVQFDASNGLLDSIVQLRHRAAEYTALNWATSPMVYDVLCQSRFPDGRYILEPASSMENRSLFGMKVIIDRDIPKDTIELRDKDDRIVGKIYNIG